MILLVRISRAIEAIRSLDLVVSPPVAIILDTGPQSVATESFWGFFLPHHDG